ncbi:MAG TPA: right-handed parallel beta-helix repeat-containing protein [Mycobacterium sp.]
MPFSYVDVTGCWNTSQGPDGSHPCWGVVEFTPTAAMTNDDTIVAAPVRIALDEDGCLPAGTQIAATDDPGTTPAGVTYRIRVFACNTTITFGIDVPAGGGAIDLNTVAPIPPPPPAGVSFYATIADEGTALVQRSVLNFIGLGVTAADNPATARTDVVVAGGGGGGGYEVVQDEGVAQSARTILNFVGDAVTAADDPGGSRTTVTVDAIATADKGAANGVATLDGTTKVPVAQIPALPYVGNVADEGSVLAARPTVNFIGQSVAALDNPGGSRTDVTINAINRAADEGALVAYQPTLNFTGAGVSVADDPGNNRTNVSISGGGGGGGYDTIQEEGANVTARTTVNFIGDAITAVDNAGATRTDVTVNAMVTAAAPTGNATTDTATIQNALDAAFAAGGGLVQLQRGTYRINPGATASAGGVRIRDNTVLAGAGMGVTTLRLVDGASTDVTGIVRTPSNTPTDNVTVRDLTIDGNVFLVTGTPRIVGLYCGPTPQSTDTDTDVAFINVEVRDCGSYGIDPHERTTRLRIIDCVAHGNGSHDDAPDGVDGITIDACYDVVVAGCISYDNARHGINLVTAANGVTITGCHAFGNGGNGLTIQNGSKHIAVTGGHYYDNTLSGMRITGNPMSAPELDTDPATDITVCGALIERNGEHGINIQGMSGLTITGCALRDNGQSAHNTFHQIFLNTSSTGLHSVFNTIVGNDLRATTANRPAYGIREASTDNTNNTILTNHSIGAATAELGLQGPASLALAAHNGESEHGFGPTDHGLLAWAYDPAGAGTGTGLNAAGTMHVIRVRLHRTTAATNILVRVTAAGGTLTAGQNFAALYDATTGAHIATTADQTTNWSGSGIFTMALAGGPFTLDPGDYYVALWYNGASSPSFSRNANNAIVNVGTGPARWGTADASITTTAPDPLGAVTNDGISFWTALS